MTGRGSRRALAVAFAVAGAFVGTASAHGSGVETPPIPIPALLAGAAVAVAATAVALAVGPDPPTGRVRLGSLRERTVARMHTAIRFLVVVALAAAVTSGLTSTAAVTFATIFVWPVLFKGALVVAAFVGSPWRVVSPWELAYDAVSALEGADVQWRPYPERFGSWPAVLGVALVVGVVENLTVVPNSGRLTVVFLGAYALAMFVGALAFGREFFERADAFTVLYELAGRVAPIAFEREDARSAVRDAEGTNGERTNDDDVRVIAYTRVPWRECARPLADASRAAFVVVAVATVTFDGAVETTAASRALAVLARTAGAYAGVVIYLGFLAAFLAGATVVRRAVSAAAGPPATADEDGVRADGAGRGADVTDSAAPAAAATDVPRALAATLLPIAVGYDVAHNYAYVLVNATRVVERALGATGVPVALDAGSALAPAVVWTVQVALVVAGHLVAVVAAHLATTRTFPDPRRARRAHAPLAALMVAYTVVSLYVLAAP